MNKLSTLVGGLAILIFPLAARAQPAIPTTASTPSAAAEANVPPAVQQAEADVQTVKLFRMGLQGGVGLDPEILDVGVHATFGPLFTANVAARPGIEIGIGELTTLFGINLDVLYTVPGFTSDTRWLPYIGAGPNFGLSHRGFETDDVDNVNSGTTVGAGDDNGGLSRFDFSDTDFNGGMNFNASTAPPMAAPSIGVGGHQDHGDRERVWRRSEYQLTCRNPSQSSDTPAYRLAGSPTGGRRTTSCAAS